MSRRTRIQQQSPLLIKNLVSTLLYAVLFMLVLTDSIAAQVIDDSHQQQQEQGSFSKNVLFENRNKILVTGGSSFLGRSVIDALLARGDQVVVLLDDNDDSHNNNNNNKIVAFAESDQSLSYYSGDTNDQKLLDTIFEKETTITQICHLGTNHNPSTSVHSNIQGTVRLLRTAVHYNLTQSKFVYASSYLIYGDQLVSSSSLQQQPQPQQQHVLSETNQVDHPFSTQAVSHKGGELFGHVWYYLYHLPFTALRFFDIYGPGASTTLQEEESNNNHKKMMGNHETMMLYIDDAVQAVLRALDHNSLGYDVFNIASASGSGLVNITAAETALQYKPRVETFQQGQAIMQEQIRDQTTIEVALQGASIDRTANLPLSPAKQDFDAPSHNKKTRAGRRSMKKLEWKAIWHDTTDHHHHHHDEHHHSDSMPSASTRAILEKRKRQHHRRLRDMKVQNEDWKNVTVVEPMEGPKTVLVTGAAGFVGSHVADHLLERGDTVIVIDEINNYYDVAIKHANLKYLRDKYPDEKRLRIYVGDIANATYMTRLFEEERPDWICHMAARAGVRPSILDPDIYIHSNIQGTFQLLELARRFSVKNFVFASSSSVYGGSQSTYFDETETVDFPISPYAASKKVCELLAYTYHHRYNIPITALRFFTVYGPRGRPDMAPFQFIDRISRGETIKQFGNGRSSRDYTYVDDIVDGVIRALDRPYGYQVFNLGKGSGTSLMDFIELVQKYTEKTAQIQVLPDQPGDVPYTCANVAKANHLLGYKASVQFEQGIQRTVQWYNQEYLQSSSKKSTDEGHTKIQSPVAYAQSPNKLPVRYVQPKSNSGGSSTSSSPLAFFSSNWVYLQWFVVGWILLVPIAWRYHSMNPLSVQELITTKKRTRSDAEHILLAECLEESHEYPPQ